jgi:hypothetical protein
LTADLPPAVLKATTKWDSYLPLTFLSDEFIKSPTAKLTSFAHGVLSHPLIDNVTPEDRLDVKTWERCCRRYLSLLQKNFPELAAEWEAYYNKFYFGGKIADARWQARLEYDILHRSHTLPSGGEPPSDDLDALWLLAEEAAAAKAKADARLEAAEDAKKMMSQIANARSWSERTQRSSQQNTDTLPASDSGFRTGQGSSKPKATAQKSSQKPVQFCIACGGRNHWSSSCKAGTQISGKEMLVARDSSRVWCLVGGAHICFNFNGSNGCTNSPCVDRAHVCSLCQSPDHGAFFCKA